MSRCSDENTPAASPVDAANASNATAVADALSGFRELDSLRLSGLNPVVVLSIVRALRRCLAMRLELNNFSDDDDSHVSIGQLWCDLGLLVRHSSGRIVRSCIGACSVAK